MGIFSEQEQEEVERAIAVFPVNEMKIDCFVEGENEIAVGDIMTVKVTITLLNFPEKSVRGFIHSNRFPYLKTENWYLIFTDENEQAVFDVQKVSMTEKVQIKENKQMMRVPGKLKINVILKNDSYMGFDKYEKLEITVLKKAENRVEIDYIDEDKKALKEPGLL